MEVIKCEPQSPLKSISFNCQTTPSYPSNCSINIKILNHKNQIKGLFKCVLSLTLVIIIFAGSCKQRRIVPKELTKLSGNELLNFIRKKEQMPLNLKILTSEGKSVDNETMMAIGQGKLVTDFYVDASNNIKLLIVRPYSEKDKYLLSEINKMNNSAMESEPLDVTCEKIPEILAAIRVKDQLHRGSNSLQEKELDEQNQRMVFSIIKKCGFPKPPLIDNSGLETIFLVIQHGSKEMRSKYIPYFIELSSKGEFSKSLLALMQDRLLMDYGKKQKYGSQVIRSANGKWELYPVDNIDSVYIRRKDVGLNSLEEYLKGFQR